MLLRRWSKFISRQFHHWYVLTYNWAFNITRKTILKGGRKMNRVEEDHALMLALCTTGIQFLKLSYDVVPTHGGFALRCVSKGGQLESFNVYESETALIEGLRMELETALYDHVLNRWTIDTSWVG